MAISSAFIDRLLGNVNIIDVIGRRITLERRGGAYWAKCPFHGSGEERTASFKVYDQTGTYHCFSCKESGNAIHFVRKFDGLDFTEAVELLASQVGMEVPKYEAKIDTSNASEINRSALQVFFDQLKSDKGKKAVNYLKERGISEKLLRSFQLAMRQVQNQLCMKNYLLNSKKLTLKSLVFLEKMIMGTFTIDSETGLCFQLEILKANV